MKLTPKKLLAGLGIGGAIVFGAVKVLDTQTDGVQIVGQHYIDTCTGKIISDQEYAELTAKDAPGVPCTITRQQKFNTPDGKMPTEGLWVDSGVTYVKLATLSEPFPIVKTLKGATLKSGKLNITDEKLLIEYAKD